MTTSKGRGTVALFLASALQCQERILERDSPTVPTPAATPVVVAASAKVPRRPPSAPGEWVESLRYRLRVLEVARCDEPAEADPNGVRLGVKVEVQTTAEARVSAVVASPGAATLEKDGVVFRASAKPAPSGACDDLLAWQRLEPGQAAKGFLIFEAPNEEYLRSSVLAFQPPRWSGELRVEVRLPDCFGADCPRATP